MVDRVKSAVFCALIPLRHTSIQLSFLDAAEPGAVRTDAVLEAVEFPAGVAHLDAGLADVHGDDLPHRESSIHCTPRSYYRGARVFVPRFIVQPAYLFKTKQERNGMDCFLVKLIGLIVQHTRIIVQLRSL